MNSANSISTAPYPYPGLRPFKQEEAELFFGRESQTNEMLTRLEDQPDFRFLAVIGASGSGKSSLVRAGLLPALSQGFLLGAPADWQFVTARPGDAPLRNLANAWVDTFHPQNAQPDAAESERYSFTLAQLRAGPLGLVRAYRGEKATQGHAVLILIDQFEELFRFRHERDSARRAQPVPSTTQSGQDEPLDETSRTETSPTTDNAPTLEQQRNEAAAFVELLLATARQTEVPMYVVITMRSDFLGDCDAFLGLPEAISRSQYLTPRMTRSQLAEAITRPLELPQFHANIEPALVTRILNDVGTDPDQLPLMQHALMRTWFAAQGRLSGEHEDIVLTLVDYSKVGRFSDALSQHLDEAWNSLDNERQQSIAQQLFLCLSERTGEGALIRRLGKLGDVAAVANAEPDEVSKVVRVFQEDERNFIIASPSGELSAESVLDISHEALLRQWGRLRSWIEEEAKSAEEYIRLADSARRWKAGELELLQGRALQRAQEWKQNRNPTAPWAERYHPGFTDSIDYLEKSQQAEAEKIRQARNARLALRAFVVAIGVILTGLSIWALRAQEIAKEEKTKANLREKAALVKALLPDEPVKALVLAIQTTGENKEKLKGEELPPAQVSLLSAIQAAEWSNVFTAHEARVTSVAMTPDGQTIVSGSADRTVRLWDRAGKSLGEPLTGHEAGVTSVAMTPDGQTIVSGSADGTVRWWDRAGKSLGEPLTGHKNPVTSVAMTPDGQTIVSGSADGTVRWWDRAGKSLGEPLTGHEAGVTSVAVTPDGQTIVSGSADGTVRWWDRAGKSLGEPLTGHTDWVTSVAMTPDGQTIVSGSADRTVRLWDRAGKSLGEPLTGHTDWVTSVAMTPDRQTIVSGSADKTVRLWDRAGNPLRGPLSGHEAGVTSVAMTLDGQIIVSGSADKTVRLWALKNDTIGTPLTWYENSKGVYKALTSIAISPDGKIIVGGSDDGTVRWWDRAGNLLGGPLSGHEARVTSVAMTLDGQTIVSGSADKTVRLWDRAGKSLGEPLTGHTAGVTSVAMTPDGQTIVSGSADRTVRLWDRAGKSLGEPLTGHTAGVTSVAMTPDGQTIVSGSADKTVRLWDRAGNPIGKPLTGHKNPVTSVAIAPDGQTIVGGSADGTVWLWVCKHNCGDSSDILPRVLRGHDKKVTSVAFSPDGKYVVSGSTDATVRLWDRNGNLMGNPFKPFKGKTNDQKGEDSKKRADSPDDLIIVAFSLNAYDIVIVSGDNKKVWLWQVGNSDTWLPLACERVRNHGVLVEPDNEIAKAIDEEVGSGTVASAGETCLEHGKWSSDNEKAAFLVRQGQALALRAKNLDVDKAVAKFQAARKLDPDINLDPKTQKTRKTDPRAIALRLAAPANARAKVGEGQKLAQQGKLEEAIAAFQAARKLDPDIDLDPETKTSETEPQAVARLLAARAKVGEGQKLALKGDVDGAIAAFQAAQKLDPDIDLDPRTKTSEKNPRAVARLLAARAKVGEGQKLALKGDVDGAIAAFQAAQKLDPDIDLDPRTKTSEKNPRAVARLLAARAKVGEGGQLAQQGKLEAAVVAFQAAQQLEPNIDLDPDTEKTSETEPQAVARLLAARAKVRNGRQLAGRGDVAGAIAAFQAAQQLEPNIDLDPDTEKTSETEPQAVARLLAARAKVGEGGQLAQQGKLEAAIVAFQAAQQLEPNIDLDPDTEKTSETEPQAVARLLAARAKVRNGRQLAGRGDVAGAIAAFQAAQQLEPNIDLDPDTEKTSETEPQAVAQHLAARAKVRNGRQLAGQGDVAGAIVAFQAAQQLEPNIDLDPDTEKTSETEPQAVARLLAARAKVRNGRQLAGRGDVAGAIAAFQAAQQLEPNIDLDPDTEKTSETEPQAVAQHLAASAKVGEGAELAQQGKLEAAIAAFRAAQQLEPAIDLDPGTKETSETDPQAVAQHLAARAQAKEKRDLGLELAQQGKLEEALQTYAEAEKLDPSLATDARFLNNVGWAASLGEHAAKALKASEKAVELTAQDDPFLATYRDTRGLARALTGDTPGAIEDFEASISSDHQPRELKLQRQEWVDALRKGQQPFTPQLLKTLWSQ